MPFIAALALSGNSSATSCPYGNVNCPYPGLCGRYVDMDGNGICDLSQTTTATTSDTSTADNTDSSDNTTIDQGHGNGNNADVTGDPTNATTDTGNDFGGNFDGGGDNYYILPISLLLIIGYLFTYSLFKKSILKRNKHRRIWNLLLTAGYLGTGGTGILLVLLINLGIKTALNPSLTFWHVELAVLMVVGTLIHVHIYWKSFRNIFRVLFGFRTSLPKKRRNNKVVD